MHEDDKKHTEGYLSIVPTIDKQVVNNLVNFSEASGAYGVVNKGLLRVGKSAIFFIVYIVICFILSLIVKNWLVALLIWIVLLPLPLRLISLFVYDERKVKREIRLREESQDSSIPFTTFYSIYEHSSIFPYTFSFLNGDYGVVLELVRSTAVGSLKDRSYHHYEVLSHFYNQASALGIEVSDLDLQSSNAYDKRFDTVYAQLDHIQNETLQVVLDSIYHHLEVNSTNSRLTYEYFLLSSTSGMSQSYFSEYVVTLINILNGAYRRVSPLNEEQVGVLLKTTFGLKEFPTKEAMSQVSLANGSSSLRILWFGDANNKRKVINRSQAEVALEAQEQLKRQQMTKKKAPKSEGGDELVDLFGSDVTQSEYKEMTSVLQTEESPQGSNSSSKQASSKSEQSSSKSVTSDNQDLDLF